jgi:magnesium chelatase family protein
MNGGAAGNICGKPLGLATAEGCVLLGLDAHAIHVEVCSTRGPAFFQLVGLAEAAVRESRVRVASSLAKLGILLDEYAITINLAPADLRKQGTALDVAIACGVLGALGFIESSRLSGTVLLGELALDGSVRPIRGVLPQLEGARQRGVTRAVVPESNGAEAGLVRDLDVRVATSLPQIVDHLAGKAALPRAPRVHFEPELVVGAADFSQVRGQASARRAFEIVAAGSHNVLMVGPPGGGKTLLARLLPTILPPLTFEEAIETTAIHSVVGLVEPSKGVVTARPFRAPHHSVSEAGLVGGGDVPRPGEVSLAHNGVLFLDELAEFRRGTLEALRQPLEDGEVCIARARARAWFPARPLVVAAVNPCPCGYRGHPTRACRCSAKTSLRYRAKLSGPLVDRIDIHLSVPPVDVHSLTSRARAESSASIRERVLAARAVQAERCATKQVSAPTNARLSSTDLERVAGLDDTSERLIHAAVTQLGLSARAYQRVLRVARTIADLEQSESVRAAHVAEAVQGRLLDRVEPA